nr:hypothetical protein [Tanacetum cinerariifolium]
MTTSSANNSVFRGFFEKQKLTGPNFIDWYRQLRIVLSIKDKLNYLESPIPPAPVALEGRQISSKIFASHTAWIKGSKEIDGLMLMTMEPEIQRNLENLHAHEMLLELKTLFAQQAEHELLQTTRDFYSCKQEECLRKEYDGFVQNYNMHIMGKIVNELHAMLKFHEQTLPKNNAPALHTIRAAELLKKKKYAASRAGGSGFKGNAIPRDGIFKIDLSNSYTNKSSIYVVSNKRAKLDLNSALLWHCRLGHISKKCIEKLQHDGLLNSTNLRAFEKYVSCMPGKMARKPYTHQVERAKDLLGLIHTDVYGPFKIMSRQGANYFITFTDDFSRYGYVYLLKHKHEVFGTFKLFQKEDHGIIAHRTPPYTLQHNRVSERRNRTLLDMVRSMMSQITLSKSFWDYALETAVRILNMGCEALVKRDTLTKPDKLESRSIKCIFIGYPKETMEHSFYYPPENKVLVARNAEFLKNSLITQEASGSLEDLEIIQEEDTHHSIDASLNHEEDDQEIDEPQSDIVPIRRSTRTRHAPDRMCLYIDAEEHELGDLGEPANYKAAKWLNAMNVEMQSMKDNEVWVLVELPPNGKTVGSKWLLKKKTDMDGVVHTYKARLIAKGYTQTLRIDYEETFFPVADIRAIRILIVIAAYYDYEIWQMDIKTAFLNGYLNEEVYMEQPEGFVNLKYPNRVCKLKRFIYGLKQASRQWNKRFDDEIKKFGFTQNRDEPCVYLKASGSNIIFLILYVDDILIMGFAMKDLGEAAYILGIKIYRDRSWWLIEKLKLSKSQGASTPDELNRMQNVPYASAVGTIMYVVRCTRPDVVFAHNVTSRFQQNPGDRHWTTVKNIIKYLRNTKDMFLVYGGSRMGSCSIIEEPISMYCDNTGAIAIANESGFTKGARHFRAKVHYLREVIEYGDVKLEKVHTDDNLADPFTKALAFPEHSEHTRNIEMLLASSLIADIKMISLMTITFSYYQLRVLGIMAVKSGIMEKGRRSREREEDAIILNLIVMKAYRGLPVGSKSRVISRPLQTTYAKKTDNRHAKPKYTNSDKDIMIAHSDSDNFKGDDVNVGNSKDVNLDNGNENDVEEDDNETTSFMALKSSKDTSKSGGGTRIKSLYERWKDDYDDNPYKDDEEHEDITSEQLAFCKAFDISLRGQIRR